MFSDGIEMKNCPEMGLYPHMSRNNEVSAIGFK